MTIFQPLLEMAMQLQKQKKISEAKKLYEFILNQDAKNFDALHMLGEISFSLNHFQEALNYYDEALKISQDFYLLHYNRGLALRQLNRVEEAIASYAKAIDLNENHLYSYSNMGNALSALKKFDEALDCFEKAIKINPEFALAHLNKAQVLLSTGKFGVAWSEYKWRWKVENAPTPKLPLRLDTRENLSNLKDKHCLIWAEQGIGDQILFGRFISQWLALAPNSHFLLDERLLPLFGRNLPSHRFEKLDNSPTELVGDIHLPLADLGEFFVESIDDLQQSNHSYLKSDPIKVTQIKNHFGNRKKVICGINWSSQRPVIGAEKSISLSELLPVLELREILFVSLQHGDVGAEVTLFCAKHAVEIVQCPLVDNFNDLDGLAALIEACDFVVSVSNSTVHIAGAIGKETHLLCPTGNSALWYWSNKIGQSSLWYPNTTIYQQSTLGHWHKEVEAVKRQLLLKINT